MTPRLSIKYSLNLGSCDAKHSPNSAEWNSRFAKQPNVENIRLGHLSHSVTHSATNLLRLSVCSILYSIGASSLGNLVSSILSGSSKKEVGGVDANGIVASVTNAKTTGIDHVMKLPTESVCGHMDVSPCKVSISKFMQRPSNPWPAFIWRAFSHLGPKSTLVRFGNLINTENSSIRTHTANGLGCSVASTADAPVNIDQKNSRVQAFICVAACCFITSCTIASSPGAGFYGSLGGDSSGVKFSKDGFQLTSNNNSTALLQGGKMIKDAVIWTSVINAGKDLLQPSANATGDFISKIEP